MSRNYIYNKLADLSSALERQIDPSHLIAYFQGDLLRISYKDSKSKSPLTHLYYFNQSLQILNFNPTLSNIQIEIDFKFFLFSNWPLLLDECMGILSLYKESKLSIPISFSESIKNYSFYQLCRVLSELASLRDLNTSYQNRVKTKDSTQLNIHYMKYKSIKSYPKNTEDSNWSIGIIASGSRSESHDLERFLDSIAVAFKEHSTLCQIIVCSDHPINLSIQLSNNVTLKNLLYKPDPNLPPIQLSAKKNLIVQNATFNNIMICHNRYIMPKDWLSQIQLSGYRFLVMSPKQIYFSDKDSIFINLPSLPALSTATDHSKALILKPNAFHPYAYVNGGCIIAKKHLLLESKWNELLFWNECEDVELSRRIQNTGVILRANDTITLISTKLRQSYMKGFIEPNIFQKIYSYISSRPIETLIKSHSTNQLRYRAVSFMKKLLLKF